MSLEGKNTLFNTNTGAYPSFSNAPCSVDAYSRSMWYSVVPEESTKYLVTLSNLDWSANVAVFVGDCSDLVCINAAGVCAIIVAVAPFVLYCDITLEFDARKGSTYYIVVSGDSEFSDNGSYQLSISVSSTFVVFGSGDDGWLVCLCVLSLILPFYQISHWVRSRIRVSRHLMVLVL